ncbi:MAG: outer membrane protein assembly factor BamD [Planctomycetota bacterium]
MRTAGSLRRVVWGAGLALALVGTTRAPAQEQRYRERQVLDPKTGQWVDQPAATQPAPDSLIDQARRHLAEGRPDQAHKLLRNWERAGMGDERYYEGQLALGEAYYQRRQFWKAVEQFEAVADNSAGELADAANRRCVDVARAFLSGQKRIVWGFLRLPAYAEAIEILDRVWERAPGTRLGEFALKVKADYHYGNGDLDFAQDDYATLVQQYPSGRYHEVSLLRAAEAAHSAFPGTRFDDQALADAEERYRQFQATYPAYADRERVGERLEEIRQKRAEKELYIGRWYEKTRKAGAAQFYYRAILKDYPDTLAAAEARTRLQAMGASIEAAPPTEPPPSRSPEGAQP